MKLIHRLLISLYTTFVVFAWLSFFFGPDGLAESRQLEKYKEKLVKGNLLMERINLKLDNEFKNLESDPERIALEARSLGYYHENEGIFLLEGYRMDLKGYSVGSLFRAYSGRASSLATIRLAALSLGIIVFFLLTIFARNENDYTIRRRRYSEARYN